MPNYPRDEAKVPEARGAMSINVDKPSMMETLEQSRAIHEREIDKVERLVGLLKKNPDLAEALDLVSQLGIRNY